MTQASPRPGRVAVFTAHYPPHVGGVERHTQCLWGRMARRGWEVLIVTADTGASAPPGRPGDLDVVLLPAWKLLEGRVPVPMPSRRLRAVWRALCATPPDVIVCNTRFFPTSVLAASLARRTRRPLLHLEHGSGPVALGRPLPDLLTGAYDRVAGAWVLRRADRCLGVSSAAVEFLRACFGVAGAGVLPNGVETAGWDSPAIDYRERLGVRPADLLIVYAGRLIAAKGVPALLDAFAAMDGHDGRSVRLAIAGDGPLAAEVARRAGRDRRITALGRLDQAEVHDLLLAADILVHPSAYPEGLPSVLLEAAAAGAAIIATPAGGTTDLLQDGVNGLIVPAADERSLVSALERLLSDPPLRQRLGAAARRTVQGRFDWRIIADTLERELSALHVRRGPS